MLPDETQVRVQVEGGVATVTLAGRRRNALAPHTLRALIDACHGLTGQPGLRVVVLRGEGASFSAGADLGAFAGVLAARDPAARQAADLGRLAAEAIEGLPVPTVVRLQGAVVGGGVVLALACDVRVASSSASFCVPEVDLGIPLAWGGLPRLVREVGMAAARDLVLTCRAVDADEAQSLGLVGRVVPDDALDEAVAEVAVSLAGRPRLAVEASRAALRAIGQTLVGPARAWSDADTLLACVADPEAQAALLAALSHRRPRGGSRLG